MSKVFLFVSLLSVSQTGTARISPKVWKNCAKILRTGSLASLGAGIACCCAEAAIEHYVLQFKPMQDIPYRYPAK